MDGTRDQQGAPNHRKGRTPITPATSPALVVDPRSLAEADGGYQPIPDFVEWAELHIDTAVWDGATSRLAQYRKGAGSDDFRRAVEVSMRAAAIDTGAIEGLYEVDRGFTVSVAIQALAWQASMQEHGDAVRAFFEAQLQAYELALDVATNRLPVTEAWLRRLHEVLCAPQERVRVLTPQGWQEGALLKGQYKRLPNHVMLLDGTVHSYAPVVDTPMEMQRLVGQLEDAVFLRSHPVLQAAYAHYAFVAIHPFQDGNGRVARALASVFLYRSASVPLVIYADQKHPYFDVLASADAGDRQPFVTFIFERTIDTINLVADQLGAAAERPLADLKLLLTGAGGLSHTELDTIGYQLLDALYHEIRAVADDTRTPPEVTLHLQRQESLGQFESPPASFRNLVSQGQRSIILQGQVAQPAGAAITFLFRILATRDVSAPFPLRVQVKGTSETLDVRIEDVSPEFSAAFKLRLNTWSRLVVRLLLDALLDEARQALRKNGY